MILNGKQGRTARTMIGRALVLALLLGAGLGAVQAQDGSPHDNPYDEATSRTYSIICHTALHFGTVVTCPAGGAVSVPVQGNALVSGCVVVSPGTARPGQCRVEQPHSADHLQIAVLGPTVLNGANGEMPVQDFTLHSAGGYEGGHGEGNDFLITSERRAEIKVGAKLQIAPHQAHGLYNGAVTVTIVTE